MILIIGENTTELEQAKILIQNIHTDTDIILLQDTSKVMLPMSKEERASLYEYGDRAKKLVVEADIVYLYRDGFIRLK